MSTVTLRIPDAKHSRLKQLAESRQVSINKLFEEWATVALAAHDAEVRFRQLAARGDVSKALAVLSRLDQSKPAPRRRRRA